MARKKKQSGNGVSGNPARRAGAPATDRHAGGDPRLRGLFTTGRDLIDAAHGALEATVVRAPLNRFDVAQLARGINGVKAAQLLMESSHWEFASGVARQLFEQLVNMEFLATRPDRTAAVESYAKFGLMQAIREQVVELEYLERTGRPVDVPHLNFLRGLLEADFDEFKGKPKADGSINFKGSWSGKPVSQLVTESKNAMRVQQYESLYRVWSAEVHAAPKAMLDDLDSSKADVYWLWGGIQHDLPRNLLLHLQAGVRSRILTGRSGQKRVDQLFREIQNQIVGRQTVLTVAQQDDAPKRTRDARLNLRDEGILVLGHQESHPEIARRLQLPEPVKGEWIATRVVPVDETERRPFFTIGEQRWARALESDPVAAAPKLPAGRLGPQIDFAWGSEVQEYKDLVKDLGYDPSGMFDNDQM